MIYKLQNGKVLPIIRKIAKPISEAERLGIPKALRSSPKALEDPYYWGYQQWNSRYNAAVNSGNIQEAQRLRDLHFKIKAPDTKVIDEYGMPLHLYHGTGKKNITAFDITKRGFNTGSGYYIDPITNEKIPIDSENTFSFSSSKNTATSYRNLARWQEIEQRMKYYDNIDAALNNKKYSWHVLDDKERQLQREFIDNILSPKLGYDLRKALNFKTLSAEQVQKLNAQIKALRMKMKDIPDMRAISNQRNNLSRDISNLDIIKRNKDKILSGESIPDWDFDNYDLSFISEYGNRDNGDVYEILSKDTEKGGYKINGSSVTKETLNTFIENAEKAISKNRASLEEGERLGGYDSFGDIIDVYANIKNPLIHDYNYSAFPDKYVIPTDKTHKDAMRYGYSTQFVRPLIINGKQVPTGYVAARQVRKAMNSGNDAVVYKNVVDPFLSDTYGIFDPRMIKFSSAITKTDAGEIIPIVKRDNFHSIDMRYKNGGIIKLQKAGLVPKIKTLLQKAAKTEPKTFNQSIKETSKTIQHIPRVTVSEPYARVSRDGKIVNEARSFSIDGDPFNTFQLIKDIEPNQYSIHFKTLGRNALSEPQKQMLFQAVADAIPGGSTLSTWGSVSKGGLAGLKRFEGLGFKPTLQTRTLGLKMQPTVGEVFPFGELVADKIEVPILYKPKEVVAGSKPISFEEKLGWTKGERNIQIHGTPKAPYYDYSLINRNYEPWTINEKGEFVFESPEKSKKLASIHFSLNEPVVSHFMGSWDDAPTTVLLPYRNIRSKTPPVDIAIMDTFFPNYEGLKISSRGSKILTGDRSAFDYYKSKGIDVEFNPEMESLINELKSVKGELDKIPANEKYAIRRDLVSERAQTLLNRESELKTKIDEINRNWTKLHAKQIPSFEKLNELGRAEGLDMDNYPYSLGTPKKDGYGRILPESSELNYNWVSVHLIIL